MTTILRAEARLIDIPVETVRTDAMQSFLKQETLIVRIETSDGLVGTGYSYTIGTGGRAVLAMLREHLLPILPGLDSTRIEAIWQTLAGSTRATQVGAITSLALAAIDTALWDIASLRAGLPLWKLSGGAMEKAPLYDTEGGWLHLTIDELVDNALESQANGWHGVKVKVGKPRIEEDAARIGALRDALGPDVDIMVDANQSLTAARAIQLAHALEPFQVGWLEEPLPADDLSGHARLAASTTIPIAVGESMYSVGHFRNYLEHQAASVIQVDVARVGGITPWLKVAHLAESFNVDVCPHFLMELHVSLVCAIPNGRYVEHIPQLRGVTTTRLEVRDGHAIAPSTPGLGIDWNPDALDALTVA
ncbi:mandelate racemase/muconate lactonizing enzyme family protein [Microbacterium rhizosphaerae]|uniref:Mandelate racemase/muconate lactonizing enzyme family protein n=1 Tax=Microbacterium rhizosphaerae TaxID=1678237 RepID=A0ABZ0SLQ1_9MICO|nr:mandelate racemase/muconate lactonizing enzyme family protein [Microbacterium rhizosphaerae]WPR89120.1 mandelate racemase/muconate lactonizing enzyme family protein [Microbacterium rhizosphaerae]